MAKAFRPPAREGISRFSTPSAPLATDLEEIHSIEERLKTLQSFHDRIEKLPRCGLRENLLQHVLYLLHQDYFENHGSS